MKKSKIKLVAVGTAEVHPLPAHLAGKISTAKRRRIIRSAVNQTSHNFQSLLHRPGRWSFTESEARAVCQGCGHQLFVSVWIDATAAIVSYGCMQGMAACQTPAIRAKEKASGRVSGRRKSE